MQLTAMLCWMTSWAASGATVVAAAHLLLLPQLPCLPQRLGEARQGVSAIRGLGEAEPPRPPVAAPSSSSSSTCCLLFNQAGLSTGPELKSSPAA
eukprot:1160122-Pelagomonas_calceolata.AAC.7